MRTHTLAAAPETVHWGFFDAGLPPVLTIESGDRIELLTEPAGPRELLPRCAPRASPAYRRILESLPMGPSSHLLLIARIIGSGGHWLGGWGGVRGQGLGVPVAGGRETRV